MANKDDKNKGDDNNVTPLFGRNRAGKPKPQTSQPRGRHRSSSRNTHGDGKAGPNRGRRAKPDDDTQK